MTSRHLRVGVALACLLATGSVAADQNTPEATVAYESTLQPAATLHRSHLAYMADTERPRAVLIHALSRPSLLKKVDKVMLARAAAEYGLLAAAQRYYKIADEGHDVRYTEAWLRLARGWYKRERYRRALQAIHHVAGYMTKEVAKSLGPLHARILLALDKPAKAVDILHKSMLRYDQSLLTRFNLGVALIRSGQQQAGVGELNAIGTSDAESPYLKALRDRANLVLAYGYLDSGQGATARTLFDRVRLDGPYTNRALLGLGWAELAPNGEEQTWVLVRRIPCRVDRAELIRQSMPLLHSSSETPCAHPEIFRNYEDLEMRERAEAKAERYHRALVAWTELAERSGSDSAIQEALVASAYAYRELGDLAQASHAFDRAIRRLSDARRMIATVLDRLAHAPAPETWQFDGALGPAWVASRWDFPRGDHGAYLMHVVTGNDFRLTAETLHKLYKLQQELAAAAQTTRTLSAQVDDFIFSIASHGGNVPESLHAKQDKLAAVISRLETLRQHLNQQLAAHDQRLRILTRKGVLAYLDKLYNYLQHARQGRASLYHHVLSHGGSDQ